MQESTRWCSLPCEAYQTATTRNMVTESYDLLMHIQTDMRGTLVLRHSLIGKNEVKQEEA